MSPDDYKKLRNSLIQIKPKIKFGSKPTEEQKEKSKLINEKLKNLLNEYIEKTKPCSIGDVVTIVLNKGRIAKNVTVTNLGILTDGKIHPTSYLEEGKMKYITSPIKEITIH
jgi:flagellar basal body L-ring protein FlgH